MVRAIVIPDDPLETVRLTDLDGVPAYQSLAGGPVEVKRLHQPEASLYVRQHTGLDRPRNTRALTLWWVHTQAYSGDDCVFFGPVIMVGPPSPDGRDTDAPAELVDLLTRTPLYRVDARFDSQQWAPTEILHRDWGSAYSEALYLAVRAPQVTAVRVVPAETT